MRVWIRDPQRFGSQLFFGKLLKIPQREGKRNRWINFGETKRVDKQRKEILIDSKATKGKPKWLYNETTGGLQWHKDILIRMLRTWIHFEPSRPNRLQLKVVLVSN